MPSCLCTKATGVTGQWTVRRGTGGGLLSNASARKARTDLRVPQHKYLPSLVSCNSAARAGRDDRTNQTGDTSQVRQEMDPLASRPSLALGGNLEQGTYSRYAS